MKGLFFGFRGELDRYLEYELRGGNTAFRGISFFGGGGLEKGLVGAKTIVFGFLP